MSVAFPPVTPQEFATKLSRLRGLLDEKKSAAIVLRRQPNFSWLTGGRGFVGLASEMSCATIVVTRDEAHCITSNIEAGRLSGEEIPPGLGLAMHAVPWHDGQAGARLIAGLAGPAAPLVEDACGRELSQLRSRLLPVEHERYRWLGLHTATAVEELCRTVEPGQTELEIAGELSARLWSLGIDPVTILIAADRRIFDRRHPLPTDRKIERYCMAVVCGRKAGLVASCTRLVHFGAPGEEIALKMKAVAAIDAVMVAGTRPGARVTDIFDATVRAYADNGFPDEWKLHHQGGLTGYSAREYIATPGSPETVSAAQAFAWNPSIAGVKSEDTILVLDKENEIVTHTGTYSYRTAESGGRAWTRPDILVR